MGQLLLRHPPSRLSSYRMCAFYHKPQHRPRGLEKEWGARWPRAMMLVLPPALDVSPDNHAAICSGLSRFLVWFLWAVGEGCGKKRLTWLAGLSLLVVFHVMVPLLRRAGWSVTRMDPLACVALQKAAASCPPAKALASLPGQAQTPRWALLTSDLWWCKAC